MQDQAISYQNNKQQLPFIDDNYYQNTINNCFKTAF